MNTSLRRTLLRIEKALTEMVDKGADDDYPEIVDVIQQVHDLRANSKIGSSMAFDSIEKSEQFIVATTNSKDDTIHVNGASTDNFDAELAFGILARVRKNFKEEAMYMLFMKMMGGAYDND